MRKDHQSWASKNYDKKNSITSVVAVSYYQHSSKREDNNKPIRTTQKLMFGNGKRHLVNSIH